MLPYRHTVLDAIREERWYSPLCVLAMYTLTKLFLHSSNQLDLRLITSVTPAETQLVFITNVRSLTVASEWPSLFHLVHSALHGTAFWDRQRETVGLWVEEEDRNCQDHYQDFWFFPHYEKKYIFFWMGCSNIPLLGRDLMPEIEVHGLGIKSPGAWNLNKCIFQNVIYNNQPQGQAGKAGLSYYWGNLWARRNLWQRISVSKLVSLLSHLLSHASWGVGRHWMKFHLPCWGRLSYQLVYD